MKPLQDLRIIAVEQYGAGPFGSRALAARGARAIKVADPRLGGDVGRDVRRDHTGGAAALRDGVSDHARGERGPGALRPPRRSDDLGVPGHVVEQLHRSVVEHGDRSLADHQNSVRPCARAIANMIP